MCQLISYVVYKGKVLFLTDADVYSSFGRKQLKGLRDADIIGHGAVREYYKIPAEQGVDHERTDFWANDLPEEIQLAVKDFEKNFGRIFRSGAVTSSNLHHIVCHATEKYKKLAWEQLLKQDSPNFDLLIIIYDATEKYKKLAWEQLLKWIPTHRDLRLIICDGPPKYKALAWKQLIKQCVPSKHDLRNIIYDAPPKYMALAQKLYERRA